MPRPFVSDRDWRFTVEPELLWERIVAIHEYPGWWPWLRRFDVVGGFHEGARWACVVAPPLPYVVRFTIRLERVEHGREVQATVTGDVRGDAHLTVCQDGDGGSRARLRSSLRPVDPLLSSVARFARPMVGWGHDWVLDQGRRQFVGRAFEP